LVNCKNLELSTDEMKPSGWFSNLIFDGLLVLAQEKILTSSMMDTKVLNE